MTKLISVQYLVTQQGPVVKLEFTPACQAGGRGFESRRDRSGVNPNGNTATKCPTVE